MLQPKVIPALADLQQDIAGQIPVRLVHDWAVSKQDASSAESLLRSFEVRGTVISSDTCGLSRLTQQMDLLDLVSLVSQSKEILHAIAREVGGRAIGVWVADNTETFYPPEVDPETLIDAMAEVDYRIKQKLSIRIAMCLHSGIFYEIGGGLYGNDADKVEYLAEVCAGPGEILVTDDLAAHLPGNKLRNLTLRSFTRGEVCEQAYLVESVRRRPELEALDTAYPHPFPPEFYRLLPHLHDEADSAELKHRVYERWLRNCFIVFLAREHERHDFSPAGLLDYLSENALMNTVVCDLAPTPEQVASSGSGIAIITFTVLDEAVDYARAVRARLAALGLSLIAAVDAGAALLFTHSDASTGITGDPVNIASKLAEDVGRSGCISVTDRASEQLGDISGYERFRVEISGVDIHGIILP